MKRKTETLDDVIHAVVRVTARLRTQGVELGWTMTFRPPLEPPKRDAKRKERK